MLIIFLVIFISGCNEEENQYELIYNYVKNNETILREVTSNINKTNEIEEDDIINKLPKDINIVQIYKSEQYNYIDFGVDEGFTSTSHYYGFYYSDLDEHINISGVAGEKQEYNNGFKWQIEGNEDFSYVEKIIDNFYYYEAHF